MGFFDWLFGDDDPQPQTYTSTQTTDIPSWIEEPSKRLIGTAEQLASQPYQPYGYSRLEPFSQQTLDAMYNSTAMSGIGVYKTGLGYKQALASGQSALSDINSYINPYTQQVAGIAADELRRQHGVQTQSDRAQAVASGAFGGSRQAVVQAERERNLGQNIANVYATANNQAFTQGLDAILRERENLRNAGVAAGSLAAQGQNLGYQDVNMGLGIGSMVQEQGQKSKDLAYQDYQAQQQYPYTQLNFLRSMISGTPYEQSTTTTQQQPGQASPGFFQQATGLGITGLGVAAQLGWQPLKK